MRKIRLAYFSPLGPQRSGIADYSEELLPYLATGADIDLFVDGFEPTSNDVRRHFRRFDYRSDPTRLARLGDYDAALYHIGNDRRFHEGIYEAARAFPGIVVLHDFSLQPFLLEYARARRRLELYLDELEACHGAKVRAEAERELSRGEYPRVYTEPARYPANCRLVNFAEGIIVHSEWSRARLRRIAPATPVALVKHHVLPDMPRAASEARADGRRAVELASFGHVTAEKGIERVLRVLASLRADCEFRYTLVGEPGNVELTELVARYKLGDRVTTTGYITLEEFKARLAAADLIISLRERTVGETSGVVCRALAAGVPVVVSDAGWFSELPDDCVFKVGVGEEGDAELRACLVRLVADGALRRRVGEAGRRYACAEHSVEQSAAGYLAFIRETVAQRARRRFVGRVSEQLSRCGLHEADENFLRGISREVARLAPPRLFEPSQVFGEGDGRDVSS